jgi:hypothetical protein
MFNILNTVNLAAQPTPTTGSDKGYSVTKIDYALLAVRRAASV